ncbi:MAG TPA: iron export ABC transporter permease subunit FetB [Oscillatoriaceae cyanobacterium]
MHAAPTLGIGQLALAAALMGVNVVLSLFFSLGLGRDLVVASLRMTIQLLLVGYVLTWIFAQGQPVPVLVAASAMAIAAGIAAVDRTKRRFRGIYWQSTVAIMGAAFGVTALALVGILQIRPWYDAQLAIPLLGMVLGNALTAVSLALDRFTGTLVTERAQVETLLALGASRWEAAHGAIRETLRVAMIPTLNTMAVMGVVSLPGMMTGQILAGAAPTTAVGYQIVIMFMIASASALGTLAIVLLAFRALFDARDRLRLDRLSSSGP